MSVGFLICATVAYFANDVQCGVIELLSKLTVHVHISGLLFPSCCDSFLKANHASLRQWAKLKLNLKCVTYNRVSNAHAACFV